MRRENENLEEKVRHAVHVARVNKIIQAAVMILFGLVLVIWSGTAILVICRVIAALLALLGIAGIIAYMFGRSSYYGTSVGLFGGVISAVIGMYLFFNPEILVALGPTFIGLIILVTGIVDMMEAIRIEKQHSGGTVVALVIAVIELIIGMVFILHPDVINDIIFKLMGITLILDGAADIWVLFQIGKPEKPVADIAAVQAGDFVDGEVRPLNEGDAPAADGDSAMQEGSFADRARARAAAKKQERAAQKAAKETAQAEPARQAGAQGSVSGDSAGYTTIPHRNGNDQVPQEQVSDTQTPGQ